MYEAVDRFEEDNNSAIAVIPALLDQFTLFSNHQITLNDIIDRQTTDIKGYALQKKVARASVETKAIVVSKPMAAYATKIGDFVLKEEIDYTISDLKLAKENEFMEIVLRIAARATTNAAALVDYGVTTPMITDLQMATAVLNNFRSKPREAIGNRREATKELELEIKNIDEILKVIDDMIVVFKDAAPQLYGEYFAAREIVDIGTRKIMLRGKIKDSATNVILPGALIELVGTVHSEISSKRGAFAFKTLSSGNYTIRVTLNGYNSFEQINIPVTEDKTLNLNIPLVKIHSELKINPTSEMMVWQGNPAENLRITIENHSRTATGIWAYVTERLTDPIPDNKIIINSLASAEILTILYDIPDKAYLRLFNPDTLNPAYFSILFQNIIID